FSFQRVLFRHFGELGDSECLRQQVVAYSEIACLVAIWTIDYVTRRFNASLARLKSLWGSTFAETTPNAISRSEPEPRNQPERLPTSLATGGSQFRYGLGIT